MPEDTTAIFWTTLSASQKGAGVHLDKKNQPYSLVNPAPVSPGSEVYDITTVGVVLSSFAAGLRPFGVAQVAAYRGGFRPDALGLRCTVVGMGRAAGIESIRLDGADRSVLRHGTDGQFITVLPALDMVVAHMNYTIMEPPEKAVSEFEYQTILQMIIDAHCGEPGCK